MKRRCVNMKYEAPEVEVTTFNVPVKGDTGSLPEGGGCKMVLPDMDL